MMLKAIGYTVIRVECASAVLEGYLRVMEFESRHSKYDVELGEWND